MESKDCMTVKSLLQARLSNSNDVERTPVNLDRALVLNSNGIDIFRESDNLCIFRRQRGQSDEQLLFVINLGCERTFPGQLSDPCVIALLADIRRNTSGSIASIENLAKSPITIRRRVLDQSLSAMSMSKLSDLGFEPVEAPRRRKYQFWLPFENIVPSSPGIRRTQRRNQRSRL